MCLDQLDARDHEYAHNPLFQITADLLKWVCVNVLQETWNGWCHKNKTIHLQAELEAVLNVPSAFGKGYRIWRAVDVSLTTSGTALGLMVTMWRKWGGGGRRRRAREIHRSLDRLGWSSTNLVGNIQLQNFTNDRVRECGEWFVITHFSFLCLTSSHWRHP